MRMTFGAAAVLGVAGLAMGQSCEPTRIFGPQVSYGTGLGPESVSIGDLDGDGRADLVLANLFTDNVSVLLNNGDGTFAPDVLYDVGDLPKSVAIGDLDGDGDVDLVTANQNSDDVTVLLNNGDGTFAPFVSYLAGERPQFVSIADLDGDGAIDLVVANQGSFGIPGGVSVLLGNGDGTFASEVRYGDRESRSVAIGDFNGDRYADLVVVNGGSFPDPSNVSVLLNNGDGTFASEVLYEVGIGAFSVAVGDLDGDGDTDLAVVNIVGFPEPGNVSVLLNNGDGTFAEDELYGVGQDPRSVAIADLDGDGDADLVVANLRDSDDSVSVLLNNGDGTFAPDLEYRAASTPRAVAIGDLDGDGDPDLAVADSAGNDVSVLLNQCGPFTDPCRADLDGDGELTIFDFLAFQNLFDMGDPIADFDGDGSLTLFDFLEFQNQFAAGCP